MSDIKKNPQTDPQNPLFEPRFHDMEDYGPMNAGGPGGKSTLTENNEKGILEEGLFRVMATYREAALGSDHDSHGVGIYSEGPERYAD